MFYELLQDYTHHGGSIKKLKTIPKGTLVSKEPFREEKGYEYITASYGNHSGFFLSKEIVEGNPEFFKKLNEKEYQTILSSLELKNAIHKASEFLSVKDMQDLVRDTLQLKSEEPDPKEEFIELLQILQEEIEKNTYEEYLKFPNLGLNETLPKQEPCHCGNDGTKPCWSTACPQRLIISYGTGSGNPSFNPTWTVSTTIHNINKKENND